MSDETITDPKDQIVEYFKKKGKMMTSRDVSNGLNLEHRLVKKLLADLVNEGTLEFTSFGGATFIKLAGN